MPHKETGLAFAANTKNFTDYPGRVAGQTTPRTRDDVLLPYPEIGKIELVSN